MYSSPSYERPQKSPQKTVSQKGFALFVGNQELTQKALVLDYPPNMANPF